MSPVKRAIAPASHHAHHGGCLHVLNGWLHNSYVVSVLSNILALIVLGLIGFIVFVATGRRRVRAFFGLARKELLLVYVSNLHIGRFDSLGLDGTRLSYFGGAVPDYETRLVAEVQGFFDGVTPKFQQRVGRLRFLRWSDIEVEIVPSPPSTDKLRPDESLLVIGSPGYNAASQAIASADGTLARFANGNTAVQVVDGPLISDPDAAFVQRTVGAAGRVAFYVAGPSAHGRTGATHYLLGNWCKLARRYRGGRPFCEVLRFTSDDWRSAVVLHRLPDNHLSGRYLPGRPDARNCGS